MDVVEAAYWSASDRMPDVTLEQFRNEISGFDVHPIMLRQETVGALLVRGPEIHACVLPHAQKRWLNKRLLTVLNEVIDKYGYAHTAATTLAGARFVEALGFEKCSDGYRSTKKWVLNRY